MESNDMSSTVRVTKETMNKTIMAGILLLLLSIGNAAYAQGEGDKYVQESLKMLLAINRIECDLRIESISDGKEYSARGHYAEQALPSAPPNSFLRSVYRLEINFLMDPLMTSGSEPNRMTLVCYASQNGAEHRIEKYTSIEGMKSLSTIDLKRLKDRLEETNRNIFFNRNSEVRNLGGLAGTMRQISRFYEFALPTQETLHDEGAAVQVWKLSGALRDVPRKELLTRFGGWGKNGQYPQGFPSDIEIWLGRHNDFPYKVRYLRRASEKSDQKELVFQESFYKVLVNGPPIPDSRFDSLRIRDEGVQERDDTDGFIKALGL